MSILPKASNSSSSISVECVAGSAGACWEGVEGSFRSRRVDKFPAPAVMYVYIYIILAYRNVQLLWNKNFIMMVKGNIGDVYKAKPLNTRFMTHKWNFCHLSTFKQIITITVQTKILRYADMYLDLSNLRHLSKKYFILSCN